MTKLEVNNEIVAMRHAVRQAKVHVVRKLIKQVKVLRAKRGGEKEQEKYKRKADRLAREILAAKKLVDDDISKFAITNTRSLAEILGDAHSDATICLLARFASHKIIVDKVSKFKAKFPSYEEYLGPGRRKRIKLKRKAGKEAKKAAKKSASVCEITDNEELADSKEQDEINSEISDTVVEDDAPLTEADSEPRKKSVKTDSGNERISDTEDAIVPKIVKKTAKASDSRIPCDISKFDKLAGISLTSKEATVKRFTMLLEENTTESKLPSDLPVAETSENKVDVEKQVDSFFMTANGDSEYLSVVLPRPITNNEEDDEDENGAPGRQWKSFSKIDDVKSMKVRNARSFDTYDASRNKFDRRSRPEHTKRERSDQTKFNDFGASKKSRTDSRRENQSDAEMHPSWAAKKKQQEILKQGFQGKKIVFGDD